MVKINKGHGVLMLNQRGLSFFIKKYRVVKDNER